MNAVERKVRDIIADILYVYPEECKPTAKIVGDLGGESVDFYDIVFRHGTCIPCQDFTVLSYSPKR